MLKGEELQQVILAEVREIGTGSKTQKATPNSKTIMGLRIPTVKHREYPVWIFILMIAC
jgi:hypothetical protein